MPQGLTAGPAGRADSTVVAPGGERRGGEPAPARPGDRGSGTLRALVPTRVRRDGDARVPLPEA